MSLLLCRMEPVVHPFEVPELGVRFSLAGVRLYHK